MMLYCLWVHECILQDRCVECVVYQAENSILNLPGFARVFISCHIVFCEAARTLGHIDLLI